MISIEVPGFQPASGKCSFLWNSSGYLRGGTERHEDQSKRSLPLPAHYHHHPHHSLNRFLGGMNVACRCFQCLILSLYLKKKKPEMNSQSISCFTACFSPSITDDLGLLEVLAWSSTSLYWRVLSTQALFLKALVASSKAILTRKRSQGLRCNLQGDPWEMGSFCPLNSGGLWLDVMTSETPNLQDSKRVPDGTGQSSALQWVEVGGKMRGVCC